MLKTLGAGIAGGTILTGSAAAEGGRGGRNHYGNGNAIGKFLNEEALYKEQPIWDSGIADRTVQAEVDVIWSNLTEVINPETGEPFLGPWGWSRER